TSGQVIDWQLPYFEPLCDDSAEGPAPELVTLTVGGNDFITFFGAPPERVAEEIATVRANVDRVLAAVRAKCPDAVILVGTIYDPTDGTGELGDVTAKDWPEGPQALLDLNASLLEAAASVGGIGTDIHARFLGHGKKAGDIAQKPPGSLDDDCWFCNVIEPNRAGAKAVADLWAETLRAL
ncbi:MAG: SGNH/GDSL hydrolase family protein, partial [Planctomycetota bacterium]